MSGKRRNHARGPFAAAALAIGCIEFFACTFMILSGASDRFGAGLLMMGGIVVGSTLIAYGFMQLASILARRYRLRRPSDIPHYVARQMIYNSH